MTRAIIEKEKKRKYKYKTEVKKIKNLDDLIKNFIINF